MSTEDPDVAFCLERIGKDRLGWEILVSAFRSVSPTSTSAVEGLMREASAEPQ
jgi:hypothetical protein